MRRPIFALTLCAVFASAASADPIPMSPQLSAFMTRPEEQQAVTALMGPQWKAANYNCAAPKLAGMNVLIGTPPNFDANGAPVSGQWRVVGRIEGCGVIHIFNVEYLFASDGQMKRVALLPGTTAADIRLQRDALAYASMGMAKKAPKDCKEFQYLDTKFMGFSDGNGNIVSGKRPWFEEWTVRACGVMGVVTIHFTPDASGTTITSSTDETRDLTP